MLPTYPCYPMGAAKDPVTRQSVANDPGQAPPIMEESIRQAGGFQNLQALNPCKEERAGIVPPGASKSVDVTSESAK